MSQNENECPVCKARLQQPWAKGSESPDINCPQCGKFTVKDEPAGGSSDRVRNILEKLTPKERAICSGLIREKQGDGEPLFLTVDKVRNFRKYRHPSIFEKADKLLLRFDEDTDYAGKLLNYSNKQDELMAVAWAVRGEGAGAREYEELFYLLGYLITTKEFIMFRKGMEAITKPGELPIFYITPLGHEYIQTLKNTVVNSNQGFCAMWYGGADYKEKYNALWEKAIEPAIQKAGYDARRIDKKDHVNDINDEMLMEIRRSRFVICDFNENCRGVYFEAGFAKGLNLPVVWTCEKDELDKSKLHFDVNHYNFLIWEGDKLEDFCERLQKRIEAILGQGKNSLQK
jgi:ssDNA-binding Zn-finger/Zn-ribbon topoisomerase 1